MNTRLQVEHPVTELVTGIDLVEQMIRVAAGEKLAIKQSDVKLTGWAVETRIYAEDPYRNFLPSTGRLTRYRPPAETSKGGVTVRVDTGVTEGSEISLFYDPMIAKLVTHAPTRERAIAAQADALDAFVIDGIRHNIPFLAALMQHKRWQAGQLSTGFIAEEFPEGLPSGRAGRRGGADARRGRCGHRPCAGRAQAPHLRPAAGRGGDARAPARGAARRRASSCSTSTARTTAWRCASTATASATSVVSDWRPGEALWTGTVDNDPVAVQVRPVPNGFDLMHRGAEVRAYVFTEREAEVARLVPPRAVANGGKAVRCPMPGQVVSIAVAEGQEVKAGEALAVVEAMKMENVLRAERDGVVKRIHVRPGDSLAVDAVILEFA